MNREAIIVLSVLITVLAGWVVWLINRVRTLEKANVSTRYNQRLLREWAEQKDEHIAALTKLALIRKVANTSELRKIARSFKSDYVHELGSLGPWSEKIR